MDMKRKLTITKSEDQAAADGAYWLSRTPEERLDMVELSRLEAGKFLYEYPCAMQKVVTVTNRKPKS